MKLVDQLLVAMGKDLSLIKELAKIPAEIKVKNVTKANLLSFYDTTRNLLDKKPKNKSQIKKLKDEIEVLLKKDS
ncbi:MAG: hypothetical protein CL678_08230 [Bdellovibrionaceae bacterium]|nr:hypothetical protein [Pseudobdellovibrionaceae bacterium]|tara:strand:+ start:1109 stop:1333 length:225 start_codon:yes stop_codon:yes gene_type:complete